MKRRPEVLRLGWQKGSTKTASLSDAITDAKKENSVLSNGSRRQMKCRREIIDARMVLGLYHLQVNGHVRSQRGSRSVVDAVLKAQIVQQAAVQIYCVTGAYHSLGSRRFSKRPSNDLKSALELSEAAQDFVSLCLANFWLRIDALAFDCDFENALNHFAEDSSVGMLRQTISWGISSTKSQHGYTAPFSGGTFGRNWR